MSCCMPSIRIKFPSQDEHFPPINCGFDRRFRLGSNLRRRNFEPPICRRPNGVRADHYHHPQHPLASRTRPKTTISINLKCISNVFFIHSFAVFCPVGVPPSAVRSATHHHQCDRNPMDNTSVLLDLGITPSPDIGSSRGEFRPFYTKPARVNPAQPESTLSAPNQLNLNSPHPMPNQTVAPSAVASTTGEEIIC
ncbi:hypothetical protein Salat_2549400 [Sesamum alatum]|uniref:Uncharacterized protein n=1 Tax=Sesamum alatum TaxID=300844 RepID=A0AAE1XTG2_9LAMI|nr:hypothetical protein Salat_2549400 [Sesamum alatum]